MYLSKVLLTLHNIAYIAFVLKMMRCLISNNIFWTLNLCGQLLVDRYTGETTPLVVFSVFMTVRFIQSAMKRSVQSRDACKKGTSRSKYFPLLHVCKEDNSEYIEFLKCHRGYCELDDPLTSADAKP